MAMIRKLIVEVVEARDLLPKDGMGTSSPYVVIDFDGQRKRTQTVHRQLNPTWNEVLEFKVNGSSNMAGELLEVDVLHDRKAGPSRRNNFLGRVRIDSRHFVRKGEEALEYFPLEKKSFFSWVRGDIGLRIYYVQEPEMVPEPAPPEAPPAEAAAAPPPQQPPEAAPPAEGAAPAPPPPPPEQSPAEAPPAEGAAPPPLEQPPEPPVEAQQAPPAEPQPQNDPIPCDVETEPQPPAESNTTAEEEAPPVPQPAAQPPEPEIETAPRWVPPEPRPPPQHKAPEPIERSTYDLVDKMHYLFVRVVRARSLPSSVKPHVRIEALGRHASTITARRGAFFEWDQTFAFPRDPSSASAAAPDSSALEVSVWDYSRGLMSPPSSQATSTSSKAPASTSQRSRDGTHPTAR